ncbi:ImmA/IrrE family metallo-endopeptidase [Virgibacillus natechei]
MAKVDVEPKVLLWAVNRAGGLELIEDRIPKISEWLRQETMPTLKQLEKLAKVTATPLGYFFLKEPPHEKLTIPHYRTVGSHQTSHPSPELTDTIQTMEQRQGWMRDYLIELGNEPFSYVGSAKVSDDPKQVAKDMKHKLGLINGWAAECRTWEDALRYLIKLFEEIGILVAVNGIVGNNTHRKLDVNEFRGFVLVDEYAPLIFVNGVDGKAAQMFTLAHELAHVWYGVSAIFDLKQLQPSNEIIEQKCNQTAAEFLVPGEEMLEIWHGLANEENRYQHIAKKFKVSELVVVRRALDLNLISKDEYIAFYQKRTQREKTKGSTGGNFYATQNLRIGRRFGEAIVNDTKEGNLLYRDAYRLLGLSGKTFDEFSRRQEEGRF